MGNGVVIQNVLARADVPAHIGVGEQGGPSRGAHEQPAHRGEEEQIGQRGNEHARPAILEQPLHRLFFLRFRSRGPDGWTYRGDGFVRGHAFPYTSPGEVRDFRSFLTLHGERRGHPLNSIPQVLESKVFVITVLVVIVISDGNHSNAAARPVRFFSWGAGCFVVRARLARRLLFGERAGLLPAGEPSSPAGTNQTRVVSVGTLRSMRATSWDRSRPSRRRP